MSADQDNGQKSQETLAKERLDRYNADPGKFVEIDEIVVCVIKTPQGIMSRVKGSKHDLQIAWAELNQKIMQAISSIEMQHPLKNAPKIHKPGGFLNGIRRMK